MTTGPSIPPLPRRWGRQEPMTKSWWRRYRSLLKDGFVHEEAVRLAEGVIGTPAMLKGRKARRKWYADIKRRYPKMTKKHYEDLIDDMYDDEDWAQPYTQFYPEGYSTRYYADE